MMTCQAQFLLLGQLSEMCGKPAPSYRQCGRGGSTCKREYAFCSDHGGDAKAQESMIAHHKEQHPRDDDGR